MALVLIEAACNGPMQGGTFVPPDLQPFVLHPRHNCLVVSGANLGGERPVVAGLPDPDLDAAENCVESGHEAFPGSDVALVDFDNPRIWTNFRLGGVHTQWNGTVPQELISDPNGWRCANCDLVMGVTGGNGPSIPEGSLLFHQGVSGRRQSISDSPLLWTSQRPGHWGIAEARRVSLISEGLRVGHARLNTQLFVTLPNGPTPIGAFPASVQLDPLVHLVPVQIFVLSADDNDASWDLPRQLALWDRVPTATAISHATDGTFGELTASTHGLANWVDGGENGPGQSRVNNRYLPDDVWAACGVQFRLVRYTHIRTSSANVLPRGENLTLQGPLRENLQTLIRPHPDFLENVPVVVFVQMCTPAGVAEPGQISEPLGQALPSEALACVSTSKSGPEVPSHELGHVIMGSSTHATCTSNGGDLNNLMCAANGGAVVTKEQCGTVRSHIASQHWADFFQ